MKILGIETSCDETAVAVLEVKKNTVRVLSNTISSQVKLHARFGGVVPNLAAREHVKNIEHVFNLAMKEARIKDFKKEIDLISVTRGPGLGPALLVGIAFAKTLAWKYDKPLIGASHLEGHIYSNWLKPVGVNSKFPGRAGQTPSSKLFPILNLIVSGGHTELILMKNYGEYTLVGETLDDAVGEAFDKVARLLNLGYPGGPLISKIAESGNSDLYPLPSPMIHAKNYNFSYSGLKTAVLYLLRDLRLPIRNSKFLIRNSKIKSDIASSFQKSAVEVLVRKTVRASGEYKAKSIFLSGGVSANKHLRTELAKAAKSLGVNYHQPELEYTGDNAAMIALAGYFSSKNPALSKKGGVNLLNFTWDKVEMDPNLGF